MVMKGLRTRESCKIAANPRLIRPCLYILTHNAPLCHVIIRDVIVRIMRKLSQQQTDTATVRGDIVGSSCGPSSHQVHTSHNLANKAGNLRQRSRSAVHATEESERAVVENRGHVVAAGFVMQGLRSGS